MSVDDHGLQVLAKSAREIVSGNKAEYLLRIALLTSLGEVGPGNPLPVDASGVAASIYSQIQTANDKVEALEWADFNSRKLRRVTSITYTAASVSATAEVVDTFNYTLQAGVYRLDSITRSVTP